MHKLPVGVLGASGYAGRELCALVLRHPGLSLVFAAANEQRGTTAEIAGRRVSFSATDEARLDTAALVFSALPHGASAPWVSRARAIGARVVDLSADLRPGSVPDHGGPARGESADGSRVAGSAADGVVAPYGLTELRRDAVRGAEVVANPGCYPTAILLALAPLAVRGLIAPGATVSIAAASGVTGAGASPRQELLFAEVAEDYRGYAVGNTHRHLAEMRAVLGELGADCDVLFTPHLLPVARGILATITVPLAAPLDDPLAPWREHYAGERFVEIIEELPSLRAVVRRNVVQITSRLAAGVRTPTLVVMAAIDNLMKGAAGQAVQNANLMLGFDEWAGLPA